MAPSFEAKMCAWKSSIIIVARLSNDNLGEFTVIESWKGDLKKKETFQLPFIRNIHNSFTDAGYNKSSDENYLWKYCFLPDSIKSEKVVLFLNGNKKSGWIPASASLRELEFALSDTIAMKELMKISMVWLVNDKVYCFQQQMNPGPQVFSPLFYSALENERLIAKYYSQTEFKSLVSEIIKMRFRFDEFSEFKNEKKLKSMSEFIYKYKREEWIYFDDLTDEFASCGELAYPLIKKIIRDTSLNLLKGDFLLSYTSIAGKNAWPLLEVILEEEITNIESAKEIEMSSCIINYTLRSFYFLGDAKNKIDKTEIKEIKNLYSGLTKFPYSMDIINNCDRILDF